MVGHNNIPTTTTTPRQTPRLRNYAQSKASRVARGTRSVAGRNDDDPDETVNSRMTSVSRFHRSDMRPITRKRHAATAATMPHSVTEFDRLTQSATMHGMPRIDRGPYIPLQTGLGWCLLSSSWRRMIHGRGHWNAGRQQNAVIPTTGPQLDCGLVEKRSSPFWWQGPGLYSLQWLIGNRKSSMVCETRHTG